jgi:hypothetical protein
MYDNNFDDSGENSDDDPRDNIGESTPDVWYLFHIKFYLKFYLINTIFAFMYKF